jgi:hypothetical protein
MGFKRNIGSAAFGLALLVGAAVVGAAPQSEPLVVTRLPETEVQIVPLTDPEAVAAEQEAQQFARAIRQAAAAEQQANAVRCRSSDPVPAAGTERLIWEANCRYRRR